MKDLNKAKGFALALFEVAQERREIEEVYTDLDKLSKIISDNPEIIKILVTPKIEVSKKRKIFESVFKNKVSDLLYDFFLVFFERDSFGLFESVCEEFNIYFSMYSASYHGIVYTSEGLDKKTIQKIEKKASQKMKMDKIHLKQVIDKSLLSGIKIVVNGRVLDYSIKGKMDNLKTNLLRGNT